MRWELIRRSIISFYTYTNKTYTIMIKIQWKYKKKVKRSLARTKAKCGAYLPAEQTTNTPQQPTTEENTNKMQVKKQ